MQARSKNEAAEANITMTKVAARMSAITMVSKLLDVCLICPFCTIPGQCAVTTSEQTSGSLTSQVQSGSILWRDTSDKCVIPMPGALGVATPQVALVKMAKVNKQLF